MKSIQELAIEVLAEQTIDRFLIERIRVFAKHSEQLYEILKSNCSDEINVDGMIFEHPIMNLWVQILYHEFFPPTKPNIDKQEVEKLTIRHHPLEKGIPTEDCLLKMTKEAIDMLFIHNQVVLKFGDLTELYMIENEKCFFTSMNCEWEEHQLSTILAEIADKIKNGWTIKTH